MYDGSHPTGKWQLYNIINDPAQNNNVADKHPDLVQQMTADYQKYSNDVGIVIPRGAISVLRYEHVAPPLNQTQTINLDDIFPPFKKPNLSGLLGS
jgi:hypothetical protein